MDIDVFSPGELPTVLGVLRGALAPSGQPDERGQRFLATYAHIVGTSLPLGRIACIEPAAVHVQGAHKRKRLVQLAAIAALLTRPVHPASVAYVRALAGALEVKDSVVDVLDAVAKGRHRRARLLTMGRMFRVMLKEARLAEGWRGIVRFLAAMLLHAPVNRDRLAGFKRLSLLPEGTLGREYWRHMVERDFGFPGEPGGIPTTVVYHDIGHVLTGYGTTGAGEIQQGCFQGGNRREDGFVFIQFVLLHFHQGVTITPSAPAETGNFHPERILWAIQRGARCNVDITHQWDFWPLMALPLAEARRHCDLLPPFEVVTARRA